MADDVHAAHDPGGPGAYVERVRPLCGEPGDAFAWSPKHVTCDGCRKAARG